MPSDESTPSLLDSEDRGGDAAEGGFAFQEHMLVARVPHWLRREGFSQMVREAMGDAEGKFFVPSLGYVREFVEYKNHQITPREFWNELSHFWKIDEGAPSTFARFVLVCTGASKEVRHIVESLRRVRDAASFYEGSPGIGPSSFAQFVEAVEYAGHSKDDAEFLFSRVDIQIDAPDAEVLAREVFGVSLRKHFPMTSHLSGDDVDVAFEKIRSLLKARKNKPVARVELEAALWNRVPNGIRPDKRPVRIVTATKPVEPISAQELILDWEEFFGRDERSYPLPKTWERMRRELQTTKDWIMEIGRPRRISLGGNRRLSSSVCIGSVFSAVSGFAVEMDYRGDVWKTDDFGGDRYSWKSERLGAGRATETIVAIGVLRDIRTDVVQFLRRDGLAQAPGIVLSSDKALTGAAIANVAARAAKDAIAREVSASGARTVHLFVAVPAPFALFLGHLLNALGEVQCYEWVGAGLYAPTCRLPT